MRAAVFNPEPIYYGDTWPGLLPFSIKVNGEPPTMAVASAKLIFFRAEPGTGKVPMIALELSTNPESALVQIVNAEEWTFLVPSQVLNLTPGEWSYHFKTTDADDIVRTWLVGTLHIL